MNNETDSAPPSICNQCLPESAHVRLTKIPNGAECKICTFPYTVYHFKPQQKNSNITRTRVCLRCAKQRNICQCCMLDLTWHISIKMRDQIISMIDQSSENTITQEAKNDMMKRFLALKDTKLGGANITGDSDRLNDAMNKLRTLSRQEKEVDKERDKDILDTSTKNVPAKYKSADISSLLKKIPLNNTFETTSSNAYPRSFFIYNIDARIPEWKIANGISEIVKSSKWQDPGSSSLVVCHKARCGGIKFKNEELSKTFITNLYEMHSTVTTSNELIRGALQIDHFRIFIAPWKAGFSAASFGQSTAEKVQLGIYIENMLKREMAPTTATTTSPSVLPSAPNAHAKGSPNFDTHSPGNTIRHGKAQAGKVTNKSARTKKRRRIANIDL